MSAKILVVDDERHITAMVSRKLQTAGFNVAVANDGEEAFRIASESGPDLVVTDLQMPYMSGLELATRLRSTDETSQIPLIMLTARGYVLKEEQIERTNIRVLMSKPFSANEVLEHVQSLLGTSEESYREAA